MIAIELDSRNNDTDALGFALASTRAAKRLAFAPPEDLESELVRIIDHYRAIAVEVAGEPVFLLPDGSIAIWDGVEDTWSIFGDMAEARPD